MPVTIEPGESLRSRLVLVNQGDGGVVVDLETGSFHRANASAWLICEALARGEDRRTLERTLERTYGLSPAAAARDVAALLASLERVESPKRERLVAFESLASGGFLLLSRGIPVLLLRAEGRSLANVGDPPCPLAAAVRWAVPHLLALRGIPVLHASAVALGGGVQAFSGGTGAGKTTLARLASEKKKAEPVSLDLLVLSLDEAVPHAYLEAERAIDRWVEEKTALLLGAPPGREIETIDLDRVASGPTLPLRELVYLDAARRSGSEIVTEIVSGAEALVLLLENGFGELGTRDVWLRLLGASRKIAASVRIERATVPRGLEALERAFLAYKTSWAS